MNERLKPKTCRIRGEIKMLSERKQELERRVNAMLEENEQLQHTVEDLRDRTLVLEKQCHEKDLQLRQSQLELQEVRVSHRQLSARLEELTEERSLQGFSPNPHSLLCEIEQSMEQEELEQEREQLRLQLWEAYCQVRSICSQLRGNDITDSALSTDSSMDESSETLSAKDVPTGSLHASLLELRRLTQNLLDGNESTGSRRSDEEVLEEQVRKLSEELRELRELYEQEQEKTRNSQEEVLQLHNQVALLSVEVSSSREENERLRVMAEVHEPNEQLQSAIRDRDEAIAKKKAVEMELAKCKIDIMSLNSQLLDAIQQKLNLSQQLEAWQFSLPHIKLEVNSTSDSGSVALSHPAVHCVALVVSDLVAFLSFHTDPFSPMVTPSCLRGELRFAVLPVSMDDMHRVIDQQLMDKHQEEWKDPPYSFNGSRGGAPSRQPHRLSDGDKRLFSFFKKN
ncbi:BICD family-like cargo adapter 1 [Labeo rohita]|uniref:BICD family-like cargo adapter 1 n=1 Tax=Labeo rohita TaxID=84645 RepID=A0ABQ8MI73_LABRO|nr:BICD family-like cargo adapter 1 [Labeo rohita]